MYHLLAILTNLPLIPFTTDETTGCTKKAAKCANKIPRKPPSCFSFHVLLFQ